MEQEYTQLTIVEHMISQFQDTQANDEASKETKIEIHQALMEWCRASLPNNFKRHK